TRAVGLRVDVEAVKLPRVGVGADPLDTIVTQDVLIEAVVIARGPAIVWRGLDLEAGEYALRGGRGHLRPGSGGVVQDQAAHAHRLELPHGPGLGVGRHHHVEKLAVYRDRYRGPLRAVPVYGQVETHRPDIVGG